MITYNGTHTIYSSHNVLIAEIEVVLECSAAGDHPDAGFKIDDVGVWSGGDVKWLSIGDNFRTEIVCAYSHGPNSEVIMDMLDADGAWPWRASTEPGRWGVEK